MSEEIERLEKDPEAREPFTIEWADWLAGETLFSDTWTVPAGLQSDTPTISGTKATIFLAGGTRGKTYRIKNHAKATSSSGRETDQSFDLLIRDR